MREPELLFAEDGAVWSWNVQDGELFLAVTPVDESHEHRIVLAVEDLAPMLLRVLAFGGICPMPKEALALLAALARYVARNDAQKADTS